MDDVVTNGIEECEERWDQYCMIGRTVGKLRVIARYLVGY